MIYHAWTVVCQRSITDKDTNNVSLDVLEQLRIRMMPLPEGTKAVIFPAQLEIMSLWYRMREEPEIKSAGRMRIETANGELIATADLTIDLTGSHRTRTRVRLEGLPIKKNILGYYFFVTEIGSNDQWAEVSRIPLEIELEKS